MTDDEFLSATNPLNMPGSHLRALSKNPCELIIESHHFGYQWVLQPMGRQYCVRSRSAHKRRENAVALAINAAAELRFYIATVSDDRDADCCLGPDHMQIDGISQVGDFDPLY